MATVFRKCEFGAVSKEGDTISFALTSGSEQSAEIIITAEMVENFAHRLLELKALADRRRQGDIPVFPVSGSLERVKAVAVLKHRVDLAQSIDHGVMHLWSTATAHYAFHMPREMASELGKQLQSLPAPGRKE